MKKRGEKSLQMIFGLFMLLIISLVVLAMFFKFFRRGGDSLGDQLDTWTKQAAIEDAKTQCASLCQQVIDDDSLIEYCATQFAVDWNEDGLLEGPASNGKWWFCEQRIPCFVLVEECKNKYTGMDCAEKLSELRPDLYYLYYMNAGVRPPQEPTPPDDFTDGCGLTYSGTTDDAPNGVFKTKYNWKENFCFDRTYDTWDSAPICETVY